MKNRILSVLLVVAMLASMVVMPVYATGAVQDGTTIDWDNVDCPCGCGAKVGAITDWQPFTATGGDPSAAGHYYLTATMTRGNILDPAYNICLDLRGFDLTRTSSYPMQVKAGYQYGIIDTVGGGEVSGYSYAVQVAATAKTDTTPAVGSTLKAVNVTFRNLATANTTDTNHSTIFCSSNASSTVELDRCSIVASSAEFVRGAAIIGFTSNITLKDCNITGGNVVGNGYAANGTPGMVPVPAVQFT